MKWWEGGGEGEGVEGGGRGGGGMAGISWFGGGGSNAHMIVEEYEVVGGRRGEGGAGKMVAIVLSARTVEQLKEKAVELLRFIGEEKERVERAGVVGGVVEIDLEGMGYTLQVGREGMEERVGMVVRTLEEVEEKLRKYVGGEEGVEGLYEGSVKGNKEAVAVFSTDGDLREAVEKWMEGGKLGRVVEMWVKGMEVEWGKLYGEGKPGKMSLPT